MYKPQKNRLITAIALVTILGGIMVMAGWLFDIPALQNTVSGLTAMKFNPALCFVLYGSALLFTQFGTKSYHGVIFIILSTLGTLIGLITLSEDFFHFNTGIDQLFVTDRTPVSARFPFPGRMAFNASLNVALVGLGFLTLTLKNRFFSILSQCLFQVVIILSAIALIGYLYGSLLFSTLFSVTSMAIHTAILFFILSMAASLLNPSIGIARLFTGKQVGNQMAKRLYALMLLIVILIGALRSQIQEHHYLFSFETVVSLLVVGFLTLILLLIWNTANWLNKIDTRRSEAEEKIRQLNSGLEKIVEERSAEFQKSEEKYRSLIEQASDAIYVLDFNGRFTEVNASMCNMMGYSRDELLGLNIEAIVDPEELKTDPLAKELGDEGSPVIRDRSFRRRNGDIFMVEVNVKKFADDRVMVIARDITGRKNMESELREAEVKFRTIAEKSRVGVYIVQDGRFVYVNPRFAEIFGYTPDEMINTFNIEAIFDKSYRAATNEHVRRRMMGEVESVHYEAMCNKKDGTLNWVEFYGSRAVIGRQPTIMGSVIDITKRKKAEEELRSSERKYKLLFDSNPLPMWMISKDDQTIIAVNDAAVKHYGYSKDELLNMTVKALHLKQDQDLQMEGYRRTASIDDFNVVRHLKKDGTVMYVNVIANDIIFEGRPVRLSMTNDVTEKLNAEESLRKSEANLQTILNTTDTAYALFDMNLKVLAFNQKARAFVKEHYDHDPDNGDSLSDYFPQDRFPQFINFSKEVLQGKNVNYEIDYPQPNGVVCWYYVRLFPLTNDNEEILGMLMALYDITERKNAEQDLKNAYERIRIHINSIKDMAWKQSHLIRSPLANLKGLIEILKEETPDAILLSHIRSELNRMDTIIIEMAEDASDSE
jgi:two-component system, sporulation sensor kinase E